MAALTRRVVESGQPTMTFATADVAGVPHARTVLITEIDAISARFHSSRPTTKTLESPPSLRASGVFYWPGRQVVLRGVASELSAAVSRAAFPTRPLGLRRLAWAYEVLGADGSDSAVARGEIERAFRGRRGGGETPPSWTTIQLVPDRVDFWQAGDDDTPATKTRFTRDEGTWSSLPALP